MHQFTLNLPAPPAKTTDEWVPNCNRPTGHLFKIYNSAYLICQHCGNIQPRQ